MISLPHLKKKNKETDLEGSLTNKKICVKEIKVEKVDEKKRIKLEKVEEVKPNDEDPKEVETNETKVSDYAGF